MTKITVIIEPDDRDADLGFEPMHTLKVENIHEATQMAYFLADVARAVGFTYVEDVALFTNDDKWASWDFAGSFKDPDFIPE